LIVSGKTRYYPGTKSATVIAEFFMPTEQKILQLHEVKNHCIIGSTTTEYWQQISALRIENPTTLRAKPLHIFHPRLVLILRRQT